MTETDSTDARQPAPDIAHSGPNFRAVELGPLDDLRQFATPHPAMKRPTPGRVFVKEALAATGVEISFNAMPPGVGVPFVHAHRENEELYLFLGGEGEMLVDGQVVPVTEGSLVRCAPDAQRAWRNTGSGTLSFAVIQARAQPEVVGEVDDGIMGASPVPWPDAGDRS